MMTQFQVNNAGLIVYATPTTTTEEQYDAMMDVNMKSVFFLSKLVAPELIKVKGDILGYLGFWRRYVQ